MDCIVRNLRTSSNLEQSKSSHTNGSIPYMANGRVASRDDTESPGNEMLEDVLFQELDIPSEENSRPTSVFGNSDLGDEVERTGSSPTPKAKKQPLLPPTARSVPAHLSNMSPRVPRLHFRAEQELSGEANKVVTSSTNGKRPVFPPMHTTQLREDHNSSGSVPAEGVKKPRRPLLPPPRPVCRTVSRPEEPTTSKPNKGSAHKPTPLPRLRKSISAGGESGTEIETSEQGSGDHTDTHFQPTSPALSSSSGIVEDSNSLPASPNLESAQYSPYSDNSPTTLTSLSPAAATELPPNHPRASSPAENVVSSKSGSGKDESSKVDATNRSEHKVQRGRYYPKIQKKTDNSWISRHDNPTSPPARPPPPARPLRTSPEPIAIPYRSHPIISRGSERQSCMPDLLGAKSRSYVPQYGAYYPPATSGRSVTPDPKLDSRIANDSPTELRKAKSSERILLSVDDFENPAKVPKRGKKAQRSISFHGTSSKQVRPVSMMDDVVR